MKKMMYMGIGATVLATLLLVVHLYLERQRVDVHPKTIRSITYPIRDTMKDIIEAILAYRDEFKRFPTGDTAAIIRSLVGDNPKGIEFLGGPPSKKRGVWYDPFHTPYKITIANNRIMVASAGPDRQWDTADDLHQDKRTEAEVAP